MSFIHSVARLVLSSRDTNITAVVSVHAHSPIPRRVEQKYTETHINNRVYMHARGSGTDTLTLLAKPQTPAPVLLLTP